MSQLTSKKINADVGDATPLEGNERLSQVICERQEASLEQNALKDVSPPTVHPANSHPYVEQRSGIGCTERADKLGKKEDPLSTQWTRNDEDSVFMSRNQSTMLPYTEWFASTGTHG